jgi:hypothetical protein
MWEVIIIVGVFAAIILFFMYASKSGAKLLKVREERMARAERGRAKIIGFGAAGISGTGSGGRYQGYKFTLEVSSEYKAPYRATVIWEVYPMGAPKVQEGMDVEVKIDTEDPEIIYPNVNGVQFSWNGAMMIMSKK